MREATDSQGMRIGGVDDAGLAALWQAADLALHGTEYRVLMAEWGSESGRRILRFYIERADDAVVGVEDCTRASRRISEALDQVSEEDSAAGYTLEVSSPGVDRPLVRQQDFERWKGSAIRLEAQAPVEGRKRFAGTLMGLKGDQVAVKVDGTTYHVPLTLIRKAHLDYFADHAV